MASLLKKLTIRDIMGNKPQNLPQVRQMVTDGIDKKNPAPVALCRIIGRTNKAKPGSTDKGEYVRFIGEFIGVNLFTGERFTAGSAILPGAAEMAVYGAIGPLNDKGQADNTVEFALEVAAKFDEKAVTQYVFSVSSLVEAKVSNPMQALLEQAKVTDAPALAAPKPETKPAASSARR